MIEGLDARETRDDDLRIRHQAIWPYVAGIGITDDMGRVALNQLREKAVEARDERDALREAARELLEALRYVQPTTGPWALATDQWKRHPDEHVTFHGKELDLVTQRCYDALKAADALIAPPPQAEVEP